MLRTGLLAARYVAMQHAHPWVVQSFKLLRTGREKLEPFNKSVAGVKLEQLPAFSATKAAANLSDEKSVGDAAAADGGTSPAFKENQERTGPLFEAPVDDPDVGQRLATTSMAVEDPAPAEGAEGGRRKRKASALSQSQQLARTVDSLDARSVITFYKFHRF